MESSRRHLLNPALALSSIALACLLLVVVLSASLAPLPRLTDARVIDSSALTEQITLPVYWNSNRTGLSERTFEIAFDLDSVKSDQQELYFFLPFFEQSLSVSLNGRELQSRDLDHPRYNPLAYYYALVHIPPETLRETDNMLRLTVGTGLSPLGALSPVYYGTFDELRSPYGQFSFFTFQLRIGVMGTELILAFFCLLTALRKPKERFYGWLSAVLFGSVLSSISIFSVYFPVLDGLLRFSYMLLPTVGIAMLGLGLAFAEIKTPKYLFRSLFAVPFLVLILLETNVIPTTVSLFVYSIGILTLAMVLSSVLVLKAAWRNFSDESNVLLICALVPALAIIYDSFVRFGYISNGIPVSVLARTLVLTAAIIYLLHRATLDAEIVGKAASTLKLRLDEKEAELKEVFVAQRAQFERLAKSDERQRITAELHDGVAGHLITILALSDTPAEHNEPIHTVTRTALDELRIAIDTLVVENNSLELTLANLRERCLLPLERAGLEVSFSAFEPTQSFPLSATQALSIFRILQEATTNAIKHGAPTRLSLKAWRDAGRIYIELRNEGGVASGEVKMGHGFMNMRRRAARLANGEINLRTIDTGAVFTLSFDYFSGEE